MRRASRRDSLLVPLAACAVLAGLLTESAAQEAAPPGRADAAVVPTAPGLDLDASAGTDDEALPDLADIEPLPEEPLAVAEAKPDRYRLMLRASFWLPFWQTDFRLGVGGTGSKFSIEDKFGVVLPVTATLPLEGLMRTESRELRLRYTWWQVSHADDPITMDFGDATFANDKVTATLSTHSLTVDFLQRILDRDTFELFLTAGIDFFFTSLRLSGGGQSDRLQEIPVIVPVGLGMRFTVRDNVSVFVSHSALSYSQLLFMNEEFFGGKDVYRNIEVSMMWEKSEAWDVGVGWRHVGVSFESDRLKANQVMTGATCWARLKF